MALASLLISCPGKKDRLSAIWGQEMKKTKIFLIALASAQLTGCVTMLEGLAEYGRLQQSNPMPAVQTPTYPTYGQPEVYQPQLSKPADHYYCTTNGGITTCREL